MSKESSSGIFSVLLLASMFTLPFSVPSVNATDTIYILPNGSISSPFPANITTSNNITYNFTDNNYLPIVVQRDNVVIDGKGWILQGAGNRTGIDLSNRTKITVKNMQITTFSIGILLSSSLQFTLTGNNITANSNAGIWSAYSGDFWSSLSNTISNNNITNNGYGIVMHGGGYTTISKNKIAGNANAGVRLESGSRYNKISKNLIMNNTDGISPVISYNSISGNNITANRNTGINLVNAAYLTISGNNITTNDNYGIYGTTSGGLNAGDRTNTISGNNIKNNWFGIDIIGSYGTTISGNNIAANSYGISLYLDSHNTIAGNNVSNNNIGIDFFVTIYETDNRFYHNNFINNTKQAKNSYGAEFASWDNGYPFGGNYWSDYNGTDLMGGPYQNMTGGDGMGDTPYVIDAFNKDNYPFVKPSGWLGHPPYAIFIYSPSSPDAFQSVTFKVSAWAFNEAKITEYRWSFGDGNTTTTTMSTITHVYAYAENFSVTLTVFDSNKGNLSLSQSVLVKMPTPGTGMIYINLDGNVTPSTANITTHDNVTYTFTGNNYLPIVVQRSNITIDGSSFMLQGIGNGTGFTLFYVRNITIKNTNIKSFDNGIYLYSSSNDTVSENNITANNAYGVLLKASFWGLISGNNITNNQDGVLFFYSSDYNVVSGNNITANNYGILVYSSQWVQSSSNNRFFHNNFNSNTNQAYWDASKNAWDDGYPSGGNFWSDYSGIDNKRGSSQNEIGSDGVGDTAYMVNSNNIDRYPLTKPYSGPHDVGITSFTTFKTVIVRGSSTKISLKVINYGVNRETLNVTLYANASAIVRFSLFSVTGRNSVNLMFDWNTTGVAYGSYIIRAEVTTIPGELYTGDNNATIMITVTILADINGDFVVGISDAALISGSWQLTVPSASANVDINGDGIINISDAAIIGINWQKHV